MRSEHRRILSVSLAATFAGLTAAFLYGEATGFADRRDRIAELRTELATADALAARAQRAAVIAETGSNEVTSLKADVSPDSATASSHVQTTVRGMSGEGLLVESIRSLPPVDDAVLPAVRASASLRNVPASAISKVIADCEGAAPPVLIDSIRLASHVGSPTTQDAAQKAVDVTLVLRSYYEQPGRMEGKAQ